MGRGTHGGQPSRRRRRGRRHWETRSTGKNLAINQSRRASLKRRVDGQGRVGTKPYATATSSPEQFALDTPLRAIAAPAFCRTFYRGNTHWRLQLRWSKRQRKPCKSCSARSSCAQLAVSFWCGFSTRPKTQDELVSALANLRENERREVIAAAERAACQRRGVVAFDSRCGRRCPPRVGRRSSGHCWPLPYSTDSACSPPGLGASLR